MKNEPGSILKITETPAGVIFNIHVQPRSSRNEICGVHGDEMKVRLTSPPVEDAANRLCVEYLAKQLGIAKTRVSITAGSKSRHKTVMVDGLKKKDILELVASEHRVA